MVSFQQDLLLTFDKYNDLYISKYNELITNDNITNSLNIEEATKMIEYIKEYKNLINSINLLFDKILSIKNETDINNKIERELTLKMLPITTVYRELLRQKYSSE
jgi:hypothetical protein